MADAICLECSHRAVIDHGRLTEGRSGLVLLNDLEKKLRGLRCGPRGGHIISVSLRPRD